MIVEIFLISSIIYLLYELWIRPFKHWESRGIPCLPASFLLGTIPSMTFMSDFQGNDFKKLYNRMSSHPWGGFYLGRKPQILARSPEFIKNIMTKDFNHFRCRTQLENNSPEILNHQLFLLENDKWRALRVKLTPTFTSGKLRMMFKLFEECAENLKNCLEASDREEIDVKDLAARFSTDIISSCAFGLDVNTINKPNSPFRQISKRISQSTPKLKTRIRVALFSLFPDLKKLLEKQTIPPELEKFFVKLIKETVDHREQTNVRRNDFVDLLMDLRKSSESKTDKSVQDIDIDIGMMAAQSFVFFVAGFETSSSVQSYAMYELSKNPDIQDRLYNEIEEVVGRYEGNVTYEALKEMTYLQQVINEAMRLYPTIPILTRVCSKNYLTEEGLTIERGSKVHIPIYALHRDPVFFPDPNTFNPDRFSVENKEKMIPYSFLPFGEGPRNCIGMRFGLLQTKLGIVTILRNYKIVTMRKTVEKLNFVPSITVLATDHQIILKFIKRE